MTDRTECPWTFAPCADPDACEHHRPVTVINLDINREHARMNRLLILAINTFVAAVAVLAVTVIALQGAENIRAHIDAGKEP